MTFLLVLGFGFILAVQSIPIEQPSSVINKPVYFPACDVFCHGDLLKTIQTMKVSNNSFNKDSKTFVDMKLKHLPNITIENFDIFMIDKNYEPSSDDLMSFINNNFETVKELEEWVPTDWNPKPKFLSKIKDPYFKFWGQDLNGMWRKLGRQMIDDVHYNSDLYSIIPIKYPVIVPGGRFNEFYYWDTYWIIRGLLHSEMYNTTKGMLLNYLSMIERFGFIPNGGRIYYAKRSQPPLLAAMIESYVEFTDDQKFAIDAVKLLEEEFLYWKKNHMIPVNGYMLAIYRGKSREPRPESYREDFNNAKVFETEEEREEYYNEVAAAAESGMDFSSRWFINEHGTNKGTLKDTNCRSIVPVELNAILYWNAKIIAKFYSLANNIEKTIEYTFYAKQLFDAIDAVLWNKEAGVWLDYDLINDKPRNYFTPTNLAPLWTNAFNISNSDQISDSVLKYLKELKVNEYPGGVPTTLLRTGEQWDFPNVWAPLQYILVEGLENLKTTKSLKIANLWGHRWVRSNYEAYKLGNRMFEKYDSEVFGGYGGGGEYDVQIGFGWTNGVIIDFLAKYGHHIKPAHT